ncbi:amine sulfotransferase-like [Glandiceps talaboti]
MATQWPGFFHEGCYFLDCLHDINAVKERRIDDWDIRDDDVIVVTFFKSGTFWMHGALRKLYPHLVYGLPKTQRAVRLGQFYEYRDDKTDAYSEHKRAVQTTLNEMPSPRLLLTHVHPQFFHSKWKEGKSKCKIICVSRNPKDVCVSFYPFAKSLTFAELPLETTWDDWVQNFMDGKIWFGSWLDFELGWKRYGLEDNVLHVTFEDMKRDLKSELLKVTEFIGQSTSDEDLDSIVASLNFDTMKKSGSDNRDLMAARDDQVFRKGGQFLRKGQVGDWQNHFTVAQNEEFDRRITRKAEELGLDMTYKL